jgi:hypothetical protein
MPERIAIALLHALSFPMVLLVRVVEEVCGDGRWYRRQVERMERGRPPLPDGDFLARLSVAEGDARWWLAVRRAVAESCGVSPEAIYPEDRLAGLWRMQLLGPDFLAIQFRLERSLGMKLSAKAVYGADFAEEMRSGRVEEFWQFAALLVPGLRGLGKPEPG